MEKFESFKKVFVVVSDNGAEKPFNSNAKAKEAANFLKHFGVESEIEVKSIKMVAVE